MISTKSKSQTNANVFKYLSYFLFCYRYFEDNLCVQVAPPGIKIYTQ